jgi:hypothetical protein
VQVELAFSGGSGLGLGSGVHSHRQICLLKGLMCVCLCRCACTAVTGVVFGATTHRRISSAVRLRLCVLPTVRTRTLRCRPSCTVLLLHSAAAAQCCCCTVLLLHSVAATQCCCCPSCAVLLLLQLQHTWWQCECCTSTALQLPAADIHCLISRRAQLQRDVPLSVLGGNIRCPHPEQQRAVLRLWTREEGIRTTRSINLCVFWV